MSQHVTYRKFTQEEEAARFIELLKAEGIDYSIDDNHRNLDETLYGEQPLPLILVKVAPENFNRLNQLLQSRAEEELKNVPSDHYLYSFDKDELTDVLLNSEQWSELDVKLAQQLLQKQGMSVTDDTIKLLKQQQIQHLRQKETASRLLLSFAYMSAILGGLLGMFIGIYLWRSKRTLSNGERLFVYRDEDRRNGLIITILGFIILIIVTILQNRVSHY